MGFLMWASYRQGPNRSVPAPWDADTPLVPVWYNHVAAQAPAWAALGVTAVLLPPPLKTNAGRFIGADGYGVYDDYDIGSKAQFYSVETRFGTAEQLLRCVAACHAAGLDVYADMVPHQRMGGSNGVYRYLGADGRSRNGRFAKQPSYFRGDAPRVPEDPVPVPADDFSFGDELCPINATPPGAVMAGLLEAGDWLFRRLGIDGCRLDDTKGMAVEFVNRWAAFGAMAGKVIIAEYDDGNPENLNGWVWGGTHGRCMAFDFSTHYAVQAMCNGGGDWNMEQLRGSFADLSSTLAATFVESPDTDTDGFATVIWNKAQGYHWIASRTGYPVCYYKDWSNDAGCYGGGGLQPHIDNALWIQAKLASGAQLERWADSQVYAIERTGSPGLLSAMNNDRWAEHTIIVETNFGPYASLHDYAGHAPDIWTDGQGRATVTLPRNDNGLGTVAYSRQGVSGDIHPIGKRTTQIFFGAVDLDIMPLPSSGTLAVGRVWAAAGTPLSATLKPDRSSWGNQALLTLSIRSPDGTTLATRAYDDQAGSDAQGETARTAEAGWHTLLVATDGLPAQGSAFELEVTYMGGWV